MAWLLDELDTLPWPPPEGEAVTAFDALPGPRLDAVVKDVMRLTPPEGGFFRRTREPIALAGVLVPADRVVQVNIAASQRHGADPEDLTAFRPQLHLDGDETVFLLPYGGGERGSAWARRWRSWKSGCWRWGCSNSSPWRWSWIRT